MPSSPKSVSTQRHIAATQAVVTYSSDTQQRYTAWDTVATQAAAAQAAAAQAAATHSSETDSRRPEAVLAN